MPRKRIGANSDVGVGVGVGIRRAKSLPPLAALARVKSDSRGSDDSTAIPKAKSLPSAKVRTVGTVGTTQAKKGICSRILTPKQVGPICWFMAAFVAMFYSQRSRKILLEASKSWDKDKNNKLIQSLKHVLDDKYLKTANEEEDYRKFSDDTFENILTYLNEHDPLSFPYEPTRHSAFKAEYYIGKLYGLLNVDCKVFDYNQKDNHLFYSFLNEELNYVVDYETVGNRLIISSTQNKYFKYIVDENKVSPKIIMVIIHNDKKRSKILKRLYPYTIIGDSLIKDNITSMNEIIFYRGSEYHLDSVVLDDFNKLQQGGHSIAGITCKKNKYIYNGWTRTSIDPMMSNQEITRNIPCELMPYDWNIKEDIDFHLNTNKCIPDVLKINKKEVCFNFSKKGTRVLIYVRKDAISATSSNKSSIKKVPKTREDLEKLKSLEKYIRKLIPKSKPTPKPTQQNKGLLSRITKSIKRVFNRNSI
jgi:hypothetical protein